jgi:hypothetical protein
VREGGLRCSVRRDKKARHEIPDCSIHGRLRVCFHSQRRFWRLGRVLTNDSAVITERGPAVRGADVCFYRYETLPRGPLPKGYGPDVSELDFELR